MSASERKITALEDELGFGLLRMIRERREREADATR